MKFLSSEKLSQHKYKTPEGYLICTDAILARTGKQTYRKCEVFADAADDESEIEIDRKAEEVFAPETLASFENKPITVEHPDENVTPDNYNSLSVGFVRDVHKGTVNGQDVMLGTLVITDARTIEEIENGEHTDLSCGYDCDIADEANPQQRNIRGNHVALCEQGRAGIARIVDSKISKDSKVCDISYATDVSKASDHDVSRFITEAQNVGFRTEDKGTMIILHEGDDYMLKKLKAKTHTTAIKFLDAQKRYAITPKRKWLSSKKLEQYFDSLEEAKYVKNSSEQADGISYVVVDTQTMTVVDSIKDAPTPTTSGRDVSKYTLQSTADKNLFFYIGERYAMKEGAWTYQLYNLNDMTAEELLEDLKKSGWKQVANRRTVIDSCDIKSYLEDQSKQESYSRLEAIPVQARQEMKNSSNKKATLLSIEGNIEDIINAAQPENKAELKRMGDKIISDLKRQFNITDSSIYTITYTDNDTTHIIKVKAEDANKAFIKFRNKQK